MRAFHTYDTAYVVLENSIKKCSNLLFKIYQRFLCMLYVFQLGNNASAAASHICAALGIANRTCRDWFKRFREGDMSLEDHPRFECPLQSDIE